MFGADHKPVALMPERRSPRTERTIARSRLDMIRRVLDSPTGTVIIPSHQAHAYARWLAESLAVLDYPEMGC